MVRTRNKSHGSSVKLAHLLFTQIDSPPALFASQARPTLPHIQNKCTFQDFSLFNFVFSPPPSPFFLSFLSLCFAARENKMFSENEIRNIMFQVLSGLVFVHKHGKRLPSDCPSLCSLVVFVLQSCWKFNMTRSLNTKNPLRTSSECKLCVMFYSIDVCWGVICTGFGHLCQHVSSTDIYSNS